MSSKKKPRRRSNAGVTRNNAGAGSGMFVTVNLSMPPALAARLTDAAFANRRNRSNLACLILEDALPKYEKAS